MWKRVIVLLTVLVCCFCEENNDLMKTEARAKKKLGSAKLLGIIILLALAKVAVFKVVSIFMLSMFFQKVLALGGILLNQYINPLGTKLQTTYGPPEYNTLGYNYGPPSEGNNGATPGLHEPGLDWFFNKNVK